MWFFVLVGKVGAGSERMALAKDMQVLALGVKPHHRLVCKKMTKGSKRECIEHYIASATNIYLFCFTFIVVATLCLSVS